MAVVERDFGTFELGDDVYELASGLIPDVADALEVDIADSPNSDDLQRIVTKLGTNRVLRNNEEVTAISREAMADFLDRSGVQQETDRSIWTPADLRHSADDPYGTKDPWAVVGGVANWQDRASRLVEEHTPSLRVYSLAGNRPMDSATECPHRKVHKIFERFGRYPTEAEYAGMVVVNNLVEAGHDVMPTTYATKDGDAILREFFAQNPNLLEDRLVLARVANSGIIMALQARAAARAINPEYDSDPNDPQLFVVTDSLPVARTAEQEADPVHFQKAQTGLRQAVLTALKLHEATQVA